MNSLPQSLDTLQSEPLPFRFLDLPLEIRCFIYGYHYTNLEIEVTLHEKKLYITRLPELPIEQVCRLIRREARNARGSLSSELTVTTPVFSNPANLYNLTNNSWQSTTCLTELTQHVLPRDLSINVTKLIFDIELIARLGILWPSLLRTLPRLVHIELRVTIGQRLRQKTRDLLVESFINGKIDQEQKRKINATFDLKNLTSHLRSANAPRSKMTLEIVHIPRIHFIRDWNYAFVTISKEENIADGDCPINQTYRSFISGQAIVWDEDHEEKPMIFDGEAEPRPMIESSDGSKWLMPRVTDTSLHHDANTETALEFSWNPTPYLRALD